MDYIFLPLPPVRVSTCWSRLYPSAIDKKCIQRNQRYSPFLLVLLFFFLVEVLSIRMFSAEEEKKKRWCHAWAGGSPSNKASTERTKTELKKSVLNDARLGCCDWTEIFYRFKRSFFFGGEGRGKQLWPRAMDEKEGHLILGKNEREI